MFHRRKEYPVLREISELILIANECSRKIVNWDLITLDANIKLPEIVAYYLENPHLYLAGGAVCDLYNGKRPNDYDMFYVCNDTDAVAKFQLFLQNIRKHKHYETANCISIYIDAHRLQFIKRVYCSPGAVVGGFDMEPCKFIYKTKVQCTHGAYQAQIHSFNPLNLYTQSQSFTTRIAKYKSKGFPPFNIWDRTNRFKYCDQTRAPYDYDFAHPDIEHTKYISMMGNLNYILEKKYEFLYSTGDIITQSDFREFYNRYISMHASLYIPYTPQDITRPIYNYRQNHRNILSEKINKMLSTDYMSKVFFKKYNRLFHVMISNVHTQYTNSFHPTSHEFYYYCFDQVNLNLHLKYPAIMCILRCKLPKPLRYMILKYWAQTLLN